MSETSWRTRAKNELEVILGGVQMRAMERAVSRLAGVRAYVERGVAHYHRAGKRTRALAPIVGIHGFGGDKETWLMMSALVPRARGITLVDLPGHGRSDDVPETQATIRPTPKRCCASSTATRSSARSSAATRWAAASR